MESSSSANRIAAIYANLCVFPPFLTKRLSYMGIAAKADPPLVFGACKKRSVQARINDMALTNPATSR